MRLWLLMPRPIGSETRGFAAGYDVAAGFVVRAETEEQARMMAARYSGDEQDWEGGRYGYGGTPVGGWLDGNNASCVPLLADGEPGVVLRDFNAG